MSSRALRQRALPALTAALAGAGFAALLAAATNGCSNHDAVLGVPRLLNPSSGSPVSLSRDVQPIFTHSCALPGCHAAPLGGPMSLETASAYASLVKQPSCEASTYERVSPGQSGISYVILKLTNQQSAVTSCTLCQLPNGAGSVSNCGQAMPLGMTPLPDAEIQTIRDWIDQGALDN